MLDFDFIFERYFNSDNIGYIFEDILENLLKYIETFCQMLVEITFKLI